MARRLADTYAVKIHNYFFDVYANVRQFFGGPLNGFMKETERYYTTRAATLSYLYIPNMVNCNFYLIRQTTLPIVLNSVTRRNHLQLMSTRS